MLPSPSIICSVSVSSAFSTAVVLGVRFSTIQSPFQAVIRQRKPGAHSMASVVLVDGTRSAMADEGDISATVEVTMKDWKVQSLRLEKNVRSSLTGKPSGRWSLRSPRRWMR